MMRVWRAAQERGRERESEGEKGRARERERGREREKERGREGGRERNRHKDRVINTDTNSACTMALNLKNKMATEDVPRLHTASDLYVDSQIHI